MYHWLFFPKFNFLYVCCFVSALVLSLFEPSQGAFLSTDFLTSVCCSNTLLWLVTPHFSFSHFQKRFFFILYTGKIMSVVSFDLINLSVRIGCHIIIIVTRVNMWSKIIDSFLPLPFVYTKVALACTTLLH